MQTYADAGIEIPASIASNICWVVVGAVLRLRGQKPKASQR